MKANLSRRLIIWVGAPAALLFALVIAIASHRSLERVVEQTERIARGMARTHAAVIDRKLSRASQIPEGVALMMELGLLNSQSKIHAFLRGVIYNAPDIYGSCVAFEPNSFLAEQEYFAPYYYRKNGRAEFVQLGNPEYNYFKWDWYRLPKIAGKPLWSEPYFDEGGGNAVMTTYSVPFTRNGDFWGIATIDIAMEQLMADANQLVVGGTGYTFIISRQGRFLVYPDQSKIMKARLQDLSPELGRRMMAGEDGFVRTRDPFYGKDAWVAFVPVQRGELSVAIVSPTNEVLAQAFRLQTELIVLGIVGLVGLFAALIIVARSISRPIAQLAQAARGVASGNLEQELAINARTEEVRDLTGAFRKMTRDLKMRMEELRYTTTVKERIEGELSAARSIQTSLLAKNFPAFPERPEIDIHAIVKPARAVGGDFYDFFFVDRDCLCLLIADVAGKGVPAALFMAVSKTLIKANATSAACPGDLLHKVNNELCTEGSTAGMFVSLAFALLNVRTGELQICNAGHPAPLRLSKDGAVEPIETPGNVALGAWKDREYHSTTHTLAPGDTVLFYTDGITEAIDPEGQFYTAPRLRTLLGSLHGHQPEGVVCAVVHDVRAFAGAREQADDLSLLAVQWLGSADAAPAAPIG